MSWEAETARAAFEAGEQYGIEVATLSETHIQEKGYRASDEVYDLLLTRPIGLAARKLKDQGVAESFLEIWIASAVIAGSARIRQLMESPEQD